MNKKLLILSNAQFGYLTDTYKYCELAHDKFQISYLGWDYGFPKLHNPNIRVHYISREGNVFMRNLRLLCAFHKEINKSYDLIFINYFRGVSILRMLNFGKNMVLDIRSLFVHPSKVRRIAYNFFLKIECFFFSSVTLITPEMASALFLTKYHILPLGGDDFTRMRKNFETIHLLYVGTLLHRNIIECVKGLHLYIKEVSDINSIPFFTIVGSSSGNEEDEIKKYISNYKLSDYVKLTGHIPSNLLNEYFENANIGIAFIPVCEYYNDQPPTKTYEYLISGLPVIATGTNANKKIVQDRMSLLIDDNANSFKEAIKEVYRRRIILDSALLKKTYAEYSWSNIVNKSFIPLMDYLIKKSTKKSVVSKVPFKRDK